MKLEAIYHPEDSAENFRLLAPLRGPETVKVGFKIKRCVPQEAGRPVW
jgi:hypothetical protein